MGRTRRMLGTALLTSALLLGTAACSSFAEDSASASSTSRTSTSAARTTTPADTSTSTSTSSSSSTSSSPGGPLGTESAGRPLHLNDFFGPSQNWSEKRYDIADKSQVQGIGTMVQNCGSRYTPQELELRLANNFDQLTFSVGQANDSKASDQNVTVEILGNNQQIDIRSVPFNQIQQFTVPVSGVNALKIELYLDDAVQNCGRTGSVIAVLTDITLN
ncbi:hypothetical protein [Petropleomorpha daqingensis]|uniref:NPCBM/NEW2 domain-containing protein n=1 Tax=Petropleomorpha daqingensis TaxID=2026353 RepID=A0A853CGZ1_9ACTN|nr:hypothetical protein [Petropleomorpha daqingensis]NYJ05812.1 hypothetical protein [Petropleomorpha daqingensis]